jgi:GT2 family glycosyltransferase
MVSQTAVEPAGAAQAQAAGCSPAPPPGPLSVVLVTFESARHLPELARALRSTSVTPHRVLVVDNASRDGTVALARAEGFEVIESASNDGFGAACNRALGLLDTPYVLFCNPDVRPSPEAIELLLRALEHAPGAASAGPALGGHAGVRRFSRLSASIASFLPGRIYGLLDRRAPTASLGPTAEPVAVDYVEGAFMLCRAEALRSVGGFDERFFLYHEEEDLCRRLGEAGWQTLLVPRAVAAHSQGTSSEGVAAGAMCAFRLHSLYWYHRRYHSRAYAELSRAAVALCVGCDRACRALARRAQVYPPGTALAAFHSIDALRAQRGLPRDRRAP